MIKKIVFNNFYSFVEESTISFEVGKGPAESNYDINHNEERINKVIAVVGANGSGKTQFIRPLAFISWFISLSDNELKPDEAIFYKPHLLHPNKSTKIELLFVLNNNEYKYKLELLDNKVLNEELYKKTSTSFSYIFRRNRDSLDKDFEYSHKRKDFDFTPKEAKNKKDNSSMISSAYMAGSNQAKELVLYFNRLFKYNITMTGRNHYSETDLIVSAEYFFENLENKYKMESIICDLDLGLSGVSIEEIEVPQEDGDKKTLYLPFGEHTSTDGKKFILPFAEESSGTQSLFVQLKRLLPILENGGIAIIDELDNDLHPHMIPFILDLFKFKHSNPYDAQLIFTCHTPEVLNLLKKHQIYLVEKEDLKSESWRLDDMVGLRSDDNLYSKYYAGALGATPDL